jgi:hypothetical protein
VTCMARHSRPCKFVCMIGLAAVRFRLLVFGGLVYVHVPRVSISVTSAARVDAICDFKLAWQQCAQCLAGCVDTPVHSDMLCSLVLSHNSTR